MTVRHKLRKPKLSHLFVRSINATRAARTRVSKNQEALTKEVKLLTEQTVQMSSLLSRTVDCLLKNGEQFDKVLEHVSRLTDAVGNVIAADTTVTARLPFKQ